MSAQSAVYEPGLPLAAVAGDGAWSPYVDVRGRQLLARIGLPELWQGTIEASLRLIDELDREIGACVRELRHLGADRQYVPLLLTVPGIS
jgi:hypothetical protein